MLRAPELGNSSFLVADPDAGDAIAIDPFRDVEPYLAGAEDIGVTIRRTLDTPLPTDFISGARAPAGARGAGRGGAMPAR